MRFAKEFSDHMLEVDWTSEGGWGKPRISPLQNFSMHPAAKVFHYAVEVRQEMNTYHIKDTRYTW